MHDFTKLWLLHETRYVRARGGGRCSTHPGATQAPAQAVRPSRGPPGISHRPPGVGGHVSPMHPGPSWPLPGWRARGPPDPSLPQGKGPSARPHGARCSRPREPRRWGNGAAAPGAGSPYRRGGGEGRRGEGNRGSPGATPSGEGDRSLKITIGQVRLSIPSKVPGSRFQLLYP